MPLQLVQPLDKYQLKRGVIDYDAVIGHLRLVLMSFLNKPEYSQFYIGITKDLTKRFAEHRATKPDFKLMCPIYQEQAILFENSFDGLEQKAITAFRSGIVHPDTRKVLRCANGVGGAPPKAYLYILVG